MIWKLTVVGDRGDVLFVGSSRDRAEVLECACEAARLRPTATVMLTDPFGTVTTVTSETTP